MFLVMLHKYVFEVYAGYHVMKMYPPNLQKKWGGGGAKNKDLLHVNMPYMCHAFAIICFRVGNNINNKEYRKFEPLFPTVLGVGLCINVHNLIIYCYSTRYYRKLKTYGLKNFLLHVSLLTLSICITSIFVLIQTINNSIFFSFNRIIYF